MTSPKHAESTARGRYYSHPVTGEKLVSVTNVLSASMAKPALVPWAAKVAAEYAVEHWPTLTARLRTDRDGVTKDIKGQVTVARDKAADLGSRIHAHADAHVKGQPIGDDPEVDPYVEQYLKFFTDFGIDPERDIEAAEMTVADPALGYAGTLDLLVRLPFAGWVDGGVKPMIGDKRGLFVVDLKTSATRPRTSGYPEYVLQLAALRYAREAWLANDQIIPMPTGIVGAAVLNLRPKSYALIPVNAGKDAQAAFNAALKVTKWLHAREDFEKPVNPPAARSRSAA